MSIRRAIDELRALVESSIDPAATGLLIGELTELITVAEAVRVNAIGTFDAAGEAGADGALTTASWLRHTCHVDQKTAKSMVHTSRALRDLPVTTAALLAATISYPHAVAIASLTRDAPIEAIASCEAEMVVVAERTTPAQLRSYLGFIRHAYAPDAVVRDEQDRYARRSFHLASSFERLDALSGWLDPEVGTALRIALEAKVGAPAEDDDRTRSQRWHDAFGQLVHDWLARGDLPDVRGERPHLVVTVDYATLRGDAGAPAADLERHGPISGEAARRLACEAIVLRAILNGPSQVLDIGRATRVVPAGMRRALVLRDKGCIVCGAPASWCEAHHVVHWVDGGHTRLGNLVLLCERHHRQHHEGKFSLVPRLGGGWESRPPPGQRWRDREYALSA